MSASEVILMNLSTTTFHVLVRSVNGHVAILLFGSPTASSTELPPGRELPVHLPDGAASPLIKNSSGAAIGLKTSRHHETRARILVITDPSDGHEETDQ